MADGRYSIYRGYIETQRTEYEKAIIQIYQIIQKLKEGIVIGDKKIRVKGSLEVEGRIKAFMSAFKNDKTKSKALDDCFGIRVVGKNAIEVKLVQQILKRMKNPKIREALGDTIFDDSNFAVIREKNHAERVETNYNAVHQIVVRNEEDLNSPLIEIQYWDEETKDRCLYGDLSHIKYKKVAEKDIKMKKQEMEEGEIGKELPEYYCFDKNGKLYVLNKEEALKKLFPYEDELEIG